MLTQQKSLHQLVGHLSHRGPCKCTIITVCVDVEPVNRSGQSIARVAVCSPGFGNVWCPIPGGDLATISVQVRPEQRRVVAGGPIEEQGYWDGATGRLGSRLVAAIGSSECIPQVTRELVHLFCWQTGYLLSNIAPISIADYSVAQCARLTPPYHRLLLCPDESGINRHGP